MIPADDARFRSIRVTAGPTRIEYLAWSAFNPSPAAEAFLGGLNPRE
ncbi:hypothetical protein [Agromyces archimandritae]|nr:hypothetical protein [Agromyces archimandritae]